MINLLENPRSTLAQLTVVLAMLYFITACTPPNAVGVDCKKALPEQSDLTVDMLDPDTCALPVDHVKINAQELPLPKTYDALISIDPASDPQLSILTSRVVELLDNLDGKDDGKASGVVVKEVHVKANDSLEPIAKTSINDGIATLEIRTDNRFKGDGLDDTVKHEEEHMECDQLPRILEPKIEDGGGELGFVGDCIKIAQNEDLTTTISNDGLKPSEGAVVFNQISTGGDLSAAEMEAQLFGKISIMSQDYKNSALVYWLISRVAKLSSSDMTQLIQTNNWQGLFRAVTDSSKPLSQLDPSYQKRALELLIKIPKDMKELPSVQAKKERILQEINNLRSDMSR